MRNPTSERFHSQDGFTLAELLVVILIIGILAAVAIPAYTRQGDAARDASAKSAVTQAHRAARSFFLDNGDSYTGLTRAALIKIDPGLTDVFWSPDWCPGGGGVYGSGQTVCVAIRSKASNGAQWEIREDVTYGPGTTRPCSNASSNGCNAGNRW